MKRFRTAWFSRVVSQRCRGHCFSALLGMPSSKLCKPSGINSSRFLNSTEEEDTSSIIADMEQEGYYPRHIVGARVASFFLSINYVA
jgi:hypothetical protein